MQSVMLANIYLTFSVSVSESGILNVFSFSLVNFHISSTKFSLQLKELKLLLLKNSSKTHGQYLMV